MVFHLFRTWLTKIFGSRFGSSQRTNYKSPSGPGGFRTISGRGDYGNSRKGGGNPAVDPITIGMTFTESEERMMQDEIKLHNLKTQVAPVRSGSADGSPSNGIVVSNQIDVTHESLSRTSGDPQSIREAW